MSEIIDIYRKAPGINFSTLKTYLKTPAHFAYQVAHPDEKEETAALIFGSALHCYVLEREKFDKQYAFLDESKRPMPDKDYRTKVNNVWKKEMLESFKAEGKRMLTSEELTEIQTLGANLKNNTAAINLLHSCKKEEIITWTDDETGIQCKALVDFHDHDRKQVLHGDLKSMQDASPNGVAYFMAKYMTHVQLAFYADGLKAKYHKEFDCPFIIACEKSAPYLVQPYFVDMKAIELGRAIYKSLLNVHARCLHEKKWEGYAQFNENHNGVIITDLPAWAYNKTEAIKMLQEN